MYACLPSFNVHQLCNYYDLNNNPGVAQKIFVRKDKFAFLDDVEVIKKLIVFTVVREFI
jgi:Cu+-exporting ATPase